MSLFGVVKESCQRKSLSEEQRKGKCEQIPGDMGKKSVLFSFFLEEYKGKIFDRL